MSALSSERMMKLMAYADGELEGAERAEVEEILATDIDAVRFVNEMAGLGELVQMGRKDAPVSKAVISFDIADAVMAKVEEERKTDKKVVSISDARERRAAPKPNRNLKVGAAVAAALALAASVFLMTRQPKEQPIATSPTTPSVPVVQPQEQMPAHAEVEVDAVESPGVSVFYLPGKNASTSVVVWIEESANGSGEKKK